MRWLLVCVFFWSCTGVVKTLYGVKEPKIEPAESLNSYLSEVGVGDTANSYYCKDTAALYAIFKFSGGVPDILAFAANGASVTYKANEEQCNGMVSEFIAKKENFTSVASDVKDSSWLKFQNLIVPIHITNKTSGLKQGVVYIIWAKWIGRKLNKQKTVSWVNEIKSSNSNVTVAFLNVDFIKQWGITEKDMPEINF